MLLTGAAGGFGQHLSAQLLEAGSRLIVTDRDACLESLASSFADTPGVLGIIGADLSGNAGCERLYSEVNTLGIAPDILINNAGIAFSGRPDQVPAGRAEQLLHINLIAPMRLCQLFLPQMIERRSGHVVNISSVAGWIAAPGLSAYCAAKFGLRGFGEALSVDLEEYGIKISTVYPWFSRTPILDSEQYGVDDQWVLPDDLVTDPADVVAAILKGVRADKQHIFPDSMSRKIHFIKRFFPWLIPLMHKRIVRSPTDAANHRTSS